MKRKSAVVTGASRGIGAACAEELFRTGYDVIVNYSTDREGAEALCSRLCLSGEGRALPFRADVSDRTDAGRLISKAVYEFGGIDLLVCNAGIASPTLFLQTSPEELAKVTGVNYYGTFYCAQAAAKEMIASGGGVIINISSMWGICGASGEAAYSSSKAAVIALTKSLAKELAPSGIRVNCVAPGVINTGMNDCYSKETMDSLIKRTPLGRLGEPKDVACLVEFLASEKASFITGQIICADGGFLL